MYVKDVEDGKRTYNTFFIIPFLIWYRFNVMLSMLKMSKIDQIHLRTVMLCMLKMGKEHTDTFFIIPFLICYHLNVMLSMSKIDQIHLRAVMLCMSKISLKSLTCFNIHSIDGMAGKP